MLPQLLKDKIPPYNDDAEKAVLGAVLVDPQVLTEVSRMLAPSDFYRTENQKIFEAMLDIEGAGERIDLLSLTGKLKKEGIIDQCGGLAYLSTLSDAVPTSANVKYYSGLVQDSSFRRTILFSASGMIRDAHDDTITSRELVECVEQEIFKLANRQKTNEIFSLRQLIPGAIQRVQEVFAKRGAFSGVPTGFHGLDSMTQGLQNQDFIIIGARPSIGKTAFALSMALNMVVKSKIPVGFFSLEMGASLLVQRLLACESKIDSNKIRSGFMLQNDDFRKLSEAAGRLYEAPLFIDDTPNVRLLDLRANARRMVKDHGVRIIFIDYIGLISSERGGNVPRHEQVGEISRSLKALARELDVPVVCLAQVGRQTEGEEPKLSHLRDSGSIEQDADIVMFLHREREGKADEHGSTDQTEAIETKVILAKYRNGPTGTIRVNFLKRYTLFTDIASGNQR